MRSGLGVGWIAQLTKLGGVVGLWNIGILLQARKIVDIKLDGILLALLRRRLTGNLRLRLCLLEFIVVNRKSEFFRHKLCQIDRETVCVIQPPDVTTIEFLKALVPCSRRVLIKQFLSPVQRSREGFLLFIEDFLDFNGLLRNLRKERALTNTPSQPM